jgi:hypothetical protein
MKKEEIKKISTIRIQEANEIVSVLQVNLPKIMNQNFWQQKVSMSEKIQYLKEIASARRNLFQVVNNEYPETAGKNVTINSVEISYSN